MPITFHTIDKNTGEAGPELNLEWHFLKFKVIEIVNNSIVLLCTTMNRKFYITKNTFSKRNYYIGETLYFYNRDSFVEILCI